MLLVSFHHQGELSRRKWKDSNTAVWGVNLQMAQVLCQKVSFFTFNDKEIFRWEGTGPGSLPHSAGSQTWRPVSGSRTLLTVRGALPMWEGARFSDPFNCSDSSVFPSLLSTGFAPSFLIKASLTLLIVTAYPPPYSLFLYPVYYFNSIKRGIL